MGLSSVSTVSSDHLATTSRVYQEFINTTIVSPVTDLSPLSIISVISIGNWEENEGGKPPHVGICVQFTILNWEAKTEFQKEAHC